MKTLLIWTGAVVPAYRQFFQELGKRLRLKVLGPKKWTHGSRDFDASGATGAGYDLAVTAFLPARSARYLIPALPFHMWSFRPDAVYLMDEMDRPGVFLNALLAKLAWPKARIITYSLQNIERPAYHRWHHRLALRLNRMLVSRAAAASREAADVLRAQGWRGPTRVIPLFASETVFKKPSDPADAEARRRKNFPEGTIVLLFAGSLSEAKGLLLLARVLPRFPRIRLVTAGGGPLEVTLREMLGPQWTHLGSLEGEALAEFYRSGDYVILPSVNTADWKEQIGRSLIEAILCGCAALGSDSGHIPELTLAPEATFRQGDAESLAELLSTLPLRGVEALRARQHRNVTERFTAAAVAKATAEFLRGDGGAEAGRRGAPRPAEPAPGRRAETRA